MRTIIDGACLCAQLCAELFTPKLSFKEWGWVLGEKVSSKFFLGDFNLKWLP